MSATAPEPRIYKGHDPTIGDDGTDVLLTIWADGSMDVATRPGEDRTPFRWGPPVRLGIAP